MRNGITEIPESWQKPINGHLDTNIFGIGKIKIDDAIAKTMEHIKRLSLLAPLQTC